MALRARGPARRAILSDQRLSVQRRLDLYSVPPDGAGAGGALGSEDLGSKDLGVIELGFTGLGFEEAAPVVTPGSLRGLTSCTPGGDVGAAF